jgi:ribonuclease T2
MQFRAAVPALLLATFSLAAVFVAAPSFAADDCLLDHCADRAAPRQTDQPPAAPTSSGGGAFDYYLLSLSWSPSFCANGGAQRSRFQCAPGAHPGFVVHGLWPRLSRGSSPSCNGSAFLPYSVVTGLRDLYPDDGLARHEWRAHGACSGKSPTGYFADVRAARDAVAIPPELKAPSQDQTLSPLDVQRAFFAANPRLRPGMMAVTCQRGALQEARICLSRDLRDFVPCPEAAGRGCRSQSMSVPAGQ